MNTINGKMSNGISAIKSFFKTQSQILKEKKIIKIQAWFRGCMTRKKRLPMIMYSLQLYLKKVHFNFSNIHEDGRINSCKDEDEVIDLLLVEYRDRIKKPKIRMWYDIIVHDYRYGWLPINIKTTSTLTCDNTGNLAMCVYAYTDKELELNTNKSYENGKMSEILFEKIKNKAYNKKDKKDYYFVILNKIDNQDVIINSVKGLTILTPNVNNLPFQVCWNKNRNFCYDSIHKKVRLFIDCLQKPKPSWKEIFMSNMRTLNMQ